MNTVELSSANLEETGVNFEEIGASSDIDNLIFTSNPSEWTLTQQKAIQQSQVIEAFEHHYQHNTEYRRYCQTQEVSGQVSTLDEIPVFPTSVFKFCRLATAPETEIENWFTSSGTTGVKSQVARDRLSIERLLGSVNFGMKYIGEWFDHQMELVNLGPDRFNAKNIWFKYVMSLVEMLYPTAFTVDNEHIDFAATLEHLRRIQKSGKTACLIGPPYFVYLLCEYMQAKQIDHSGEDQLYIITGGGWKTHEDKALVREEFNRLLMDTFKLKECSQIRDTFNQVELNTCFFEDDAQCKRVPPWVYARALDPKTLRPMPLGEPGLLSFMDASANSYPAFLITEDIGIIREKESDRPGTTIEIVRRVNTRAQKGCALSMSQSFGQ
ncbi:MAG: long-chain fatty acid--CoA ligase [Gammaproteobacteria bacterium]|nr:long-chain fatty acid--CoA ligase [Gammaproteobacteria bacterium]